MTTTEENKQFLAMTQDAFDGVDNPEFEKIENVKVRECVVATFAAMNYAYSVCDPQNGDWDCIVDDFLAGVQWARTPYSMEKRGDIHEQIRLGAKDSDLTPKDFALLAAMDHYDKLREFSKTLPQFFKTIDSQPYADNASKKVKNKTYKTVLEGMQVMCRTLDDLHNSFQKAVVYLEEGAKA